MQDIAAIRAAASAAALNPAEEQFIEQTPWANPKHPSHAHLLQRQAGHQGNRNSSPFGMVAAQQSRKHSGPAPGGLPVSGTFSGVGGGSMAHTHAVPGARRPLNEYGF